MARLDNLDYEVNGVTTNYEIVPEIAPLFNATTAYAAGDTVIKDGHLYRFNTAHAAGAWIGTDADEITVGEELTSHGADITELKADINELDAKVDELESLEKTRGLSPAQIKQICDDGLAKEYFSIGDIINVEWQDKSPSTPVTYTVPMVVAHFGDVYDDEGNLHEDAMFLMWMYATPQAIQFDAPEAIVETESTFQEGYYYYTKNADNSFTEQTVTPGAEIPAGTTYYKHVRSGMTERLRYGSDDYTESAFRQWLNSDGGKGEWWTAQHDSDVAPSQASTVPGFLTGFSQEWLDIIKPVKIQVAANTVCDGGVTKTVYDRFFLPSLEQMYGSPQASGVEGEYWEYWKNETGLPSPSNGSSTNTNDARKIPAISNPAGSAVSCWLRSASRSNSYGVWLVSAAGYLYGYGAGTSYRVQPACVIY